VTSAARELDEMLIEREADRQREFLRRRNELPDEWSASAFAHGTYRWMTSPELDELSSEIETLFERYSNRHDPTSRPDGARIVRLLGMALPLLTPAPPVDPQPDDNRR
jgi:hypothetical protein